MIKMNTTLLILICTIVIATHFYPGILHKIKTMYLRPEISMFEFVMFVIIGYLMASLFYG